MSRQFIILILSGLISFFLIGCLDDDFEEQPTIFSFTFTLPDGEGWHITQTGDSLRVLNFTMLVDSIEVSKQGLDNDIFEPDPRLVSFSTLGLADESSIGTGGLTGGRYEGVEFTLVKPGMDTNIMNESLVLRDDQGNVTNTYSFAITGVTQMNGEVDEFIFRSEIVRSLNYGFLEVVEMPETLGTLSVQLRGIWQNWFRDPDNPDLILNPNQAANRSQIEENILEKFDIMTFDVGGS